MIASCQLRALAQRIADPRSLLLDRSVEVDVGAKTLRFFPRDLQAIDAPSRQFQEVARQVLRFREYGKTLELIFN